MEDADRSACDRTGRLERHAEPLAYLSDRPIGELVPVDFEQVDAETVAHDLAAPDRVRDPLVHTGCSDVALANITVEESCGRDVSGLEQTDQRRQPRETLRVGIGATDEPEDLEL